MRWLSEIYKIGNGNARARQAIRKFSFVGDKLKRTAYSISGLTHAACRNITYADNALQIWGDMPP